MKLFRAMRTNRITQKFGENKVDTYKKMGMLGHNGWDWRCYNGEPIYWDCDLEGKVINTHIDRTGGWGVKVITKDEEGLMKHLLWHLQTFAVKPGDIVQPGDLIGLGDTTGRATGPHLHRGIKPVREIEYKDYENIYGDNGYFGGIDPEFYYSNIFVKDWVKYTKKISILEQMVATLKEIIRLWQLKRSVK